MQKKKDEEILKIRISDKGAVFAAQSHINTIINITGLLKNYKIETVGELVSQLKVQLKKNKGWLEKRVPDGTLYDVINKKELKNLIKEAENVLSWDVVPSDKDYLRLEKNRKELEQLKKEKQKEIDTRIDIPMRITFDTSFLISSLIENEINNNSCKLVIDYLKHQSNYFDIFLPNFVILEFISKLKQDKFSISKIKKEFEKLIYSLNNGYFYSPDKDFNLFSIFSRYEKFSKKQISSKLKSNDFIIITDAILADSILVTCDKKMFDEGRKFYKKVFLINNKPESYTKFINSFEKIKKEL